MRGNSVSHTIAEFELMVTPTRRSWTLRVFINCCNSAANCCCASGRPTAAWDVDAMAYSDSCSLAPSRRRTAALIRLVPRSRPMAASRLFCLALLKNIILLKFLALHMLLIHDGSSCSSPEGISTHYAPQSM